jgi:flagellar motor switch protein FliG
VTTLPATMSTRRAMLLLVALALEGEKARGLFELLPEREARELKATADKLLEVPEKGRQAFLLREMKRYRKQANASLLGPIDDQWILARLERERPRTIRLVLEELPDSRRDRIVGGLPAETAHAVLLPEEGGESIPKAVREIVRDRFEGSFVGIDAVRLATRFDHIASLRPRDIRAVIRGLGLDEMAIAYRGVARDQLVQLVRNMGRRDEAELVARIKAHAEVERARVKRALRELRELASGMLLTGNLPQEVGTDRLARASVPADRAWCRYVAQKLPLREGEALLCRRDRAGNVELETAGRLQRAAVEEARRLARAGRLDPQWARVFEG